MKKALTTLVHNSPFWDTFDPKPIQLLKNELTGFDNLFVLTRL